MTWHYHIQHSEVSTSLTIPIREYRLNGRIFNVASSYLTSRSHFFSKDIHIALPNIKTTVKLKEVEFNLESSYSTPRRQYLFNLKEKVQL